MKTNYLVLLLLVAGLVLDAGYAPLASADTITVVNLNDSGLGSLRQTIADATPGDTINFSVNGTITLTSSHLRVDKNLTIEGPGSDDLSISGNNSSRVFLIFGFGDVMVSISDLTVRDGKELDGGGIQNWLGTLELNNIVVSNNESERSGGGISDVGGTLIIANSKISDNKGNGISLSTGSSLTISNSTISNNDGLRGGGIAARGNSVSVVDSTISNNRAGLGGGIDNRSDILTITNSTISNNEVHPVCCVITTGGGIANFRTLNLTNTTINGNTSVEDGGGIYNSGSVTLTNTIIANNSAGGDCSGSFTSLGYNLDSDGTCTLTQPTDLPSTDPVLGSLTDNGGPTETHALLEGSPAIDAGGANCTDASGQPLLADQRGELRPVDGNGDSQTACDIGAYETQLAISTITIDIKPDSQTNSVNPRSKGVIAVAILTSEDFDALQVDPDTVLFGPADAEKAHTQAHVEDVDNDGDMDLQLHFKTQETGIQCVDTEATLTGNTWGGTPISGTDSVNTVGCK